MSENQNENDNSGSEQRTEESVEKTQVTETPNSTFGDVTAGVTETPTARTEETVKETKVHEEGSSDES